MPATHSHTAFNLFNYKHIKHQNAPPLIGPMQSGIDAPTGKPVDANPADVVKGKPYDFSFLTTSSNPVNVSYTTTCGDAAPVDLGIVAVGGTVKFSYDFSKATAPGTCDITVNLLDTVNGKRSTVTHSVYVLPYEVACAKRMDWAEVAVCSPLEPACKKNLRLTIACSRPSDLRGLLLNAGSGGGGAADMVASGLTINLEVDWGDGSPRETRQEMFDGSQQSSYTLTVGHNYDSTGKFVPQAWLQLVRDQGGGRFLGGCLLMPLLEWACLGTAVGTTGCACVSSFWRLDHSKQRPRAADR
jgi:hypothetical protein